MTPYYEMVGSRYQLFPVSGSPTFHGYAVARGELALPIGLAFSGPRRACSADIVGSGSASLYLVSERVAEKFDREKVTGWRAEEVVTNCDDRYFALVILGRCGSINYSLSTVVEKVVNGRSVKWWKGSYFDEGSWDGSDLFTPRDVGTVFMVERVRGMLAEFSLPGVEMVPLADVERMILPSIVQH